MLRSNFLEVGGPEIFIFSPTLSFKRWTISWLMKSHGLPDPLRGPNHLQFSGLIPESLVIFLLTLSPLYDNHWSHLSSLSPTGLTNCSWMPFKWFSLVFRTRYEYLALFAPPSYHHLMNKMIAVSNFKPNKSIMIVRIAWFFNEVCHVIKILLQNVYIWLYFEIFIQIISVDARWGNSPSLLQLRAD